MNIKQGGLRAEEKAPSHTAGVKVTGAQRARFAQELLRKMKKGERDEMEKKKTLCSAGCDCAALKLENGSE